MTKMPTIGICDSFKEEIMSEYQKNVLYFCVACLMGIAYICIGVFLVPSDSGDRWVYIDSGVFLLDFCVWFYYDTLRYH